MRYSDNIFYGGSSNKKNNNNKIEVSDQQAQRFINNDWSSAWIFHNDTMNKPIKTKKQYAKLIKDIKKTRKKKQEERMSKFSLSQKWELEQVIYLAL